MQTNIKSHCCNANIEISGRGDFRDKDEICTRYYICTKCKKPCMAKEINKLK